MIDGTRGPSVVSMAESSWIAGAVSISVAAGIGSGSAATESVPAFTTTSGSRCVTGRGGRICSIAETKRTGW
jgi:hypothetical protein